MGLKCSRESCVIGNKIWEAQGVKKAQQWDILSGFLYPFKSFPLMQSSTKRTRPIKTHGAPSICQAQGARHWVKPLKVRQRWVWWSNIFKGFTDSGGWSPSLSFFSYKIVWGEPCPRVETSAVIWRMVKSALMHWGRGLFPANLNRWWDSEGEHGGWGKQFLLPYFARLSSLFSLFFKAHGSNLRCQLLLRTCLLRRTELAIASWPLCDPCRLTLWLHTAFPLIRVHVQPWISLKSLQPLPSPPNSKVLLVKALVN